MNLQEAVLCVECEWISDQASHCPRCGCRVLFPIARAMNRRLGAVGRLSQPAPPPPRLVGREGRPAAPRARPPAEPFGGVEETTTRPRVRTA